MQPTGGPDEQAAALRDAMRVLFPEAVALVSAARQGFMREAVDARDRELAHARSRGPLRPRRRLRPARPFPRSVVQRVSAPYIAGPTLDDARRTVVALNAEGKRATIDVLGEEIHSAEEARAIAAAYGDVLAAIEADGLDANVSVKLTGLGLKLDLEPLPLAARRPRPRCRGPRLLRPDRHGGRTCVDDTLALYRTLRGAGLDNVGIVLQA